MILKAAVIGTHGTFKSTLVDHLSGALKEEGAEVYIVQERAKKCPYQINGVDIRAQKWIVSRQYMKEMEEVSSFQKIEEAAPHTKDMPRIVVCDRSTLDAYIYTIDLCRKQKINMPAWIPAQVSENMPSYDFLFLTSISPKGLTDDGQRAANVKDEEERQKNIKYQRDIDNIMRHYLQKKKIKHYTLDYKLIEGKENPSNNDYKRLRESQVEFMVDIITKKWKK